MKISMEGRTALVTGASGELGRVIARTLAECGCNVALHYYGSEEKAKKVRDDILETGRRAIVVKADVGDLESVQAMGEVIKKELGSPQIVVAAAVAQYSWTTVLKQPIEDYESQFKTCVLQNVNLAKVFIPDMQEKGYGRYIGINTECAMQMFETQSAYAAAKRGMDGVLKVLAKEVGRYGITVNEVAPGWTISDKDRNLKERKDSHYTKDVPLLRRGTDKEIAYAAAFLASDLAGFITGVYLPVCGGNVMPGI